MRLRKPNLTPLTRFEKKRRSDGGAGLPGAERMQCTAGWLRKRCGLGERARTRATIRYRQARNAAARESRMRQRRRKLKRAACAVVLEFTDLSPAGQVSLVVRRQGSGL